MFRTAFYYSLRLIAASCLFQPMTAQAFEIDMHTTGVVNGLTGLLPGVRLCASFSRTGEGTTYKSVDEPTMRNGMRTIKTGEDGHHKIRLGEFTQFDGAIIIAGEKQGYCPTVCEVLIKFDRTLTQEEATQPGHYIPRHPPPRISCSMHLRAASSSSCGRTDHSGTQYPNYLASQTFTTTDPYTRHKTIKMNGSVFADQCGPVLPADLFLIEKQSSKLPSPEMKKRTNVRTLKKTPQTSMPKVEAERR